MQSLAGRTLRTTAIHAPVRGAIDHLDDALIVVGGAVTVAAGACLVGVVAVRPACCL